MFFDVRSLLLCDGALVIDDVLELIDLHTSSHGMLFLLDASISIYSHLDDCLEVISQLHSSCTYLLMRH